MDGSTANTFKDASWLETLAFLGSMLNFFLPMAICLFLWVVLLQTKEERRFTCGNCFQSTDSLSELKWNKFEQIKSVKRASNVSHPISSVRRLNKRRAASCLYLYSLWFHNYTFEWLATCQPLRGKTVKVCVAVLPLGLCCSPDCEQKRFY